MSGAVERVKLAAPVVLTATVENGTEGGKMTTAWVRVAPSHHGPGNVFEMQAAHGWMHLWALDTLRGECKYSSGRPCGDTMYIDAGQRWIVTGMLAVMAECNAKGY